MPIDTQIESNPVDSQQVKQSSPLAQVSTGGANLGNVNNLLGQSIKGLEESRNKKRAILDKAITDLQSRLPSPMGQTGPSAEEYFKLAAAMGAPTRTGGFGETLSNFAGAAGDILGKRRESDRSLQDLMLKYELQGADLDTDYMKNLLSAHKELGGAQSNYGKVAMDEGLQPGSPAFAKRVTELARIDQQAKLSKNQMPTAGEFDKKTGNYITPSGAVIKASEVSKDREKIQSLSDLSNRLSDLSPKRLKEAESWFDQSSGIGKAVGSRLGTKAYKAQVEIQASGVQEVLNNLPPGPASDKDIAQAKSSFPGYADAGALAEWVERTQRMIERKQEQMTNKYGSESWWGESGTSGAKAKKTGSSEGQNRNELGETPSEQKRLKTPPAKTPKVGAVLDGHRFKGGDPSKKENWEPI